MTICLSWQFIKILGLLIIELHNISPFGRRCFQPLRNMLCVTKFMLGTIIPILMCMKNALSFSKNQMGFPSALNIYLYQICSLWPQYVVTNQKGFLLMVSMCLGITSPLSSYNLAIHAIYILLGS
jgi:hypothetical protein